MGQLSTPADMLKSRVKPRSWICAGFIPKRASTEKIFEPMISAVTAFVMKNPHRMMSKMVLRLFIGKFLMVNIGNDIFTWEKFYLS